MEGRLGSGALLLRTLQAPKKIPDQRPGSVKPVIESPQHPALEWGRSDSRRLPFTPLPIGLVCVFAQAPDLVPSSEWMGWCVALPVAVCLRPELSATTCGVISSSRFESVRVDHVNAA